MNQPNLIELLKEMLTTLQDIGNTILLNKVMNYTKLHQN